MPWERPTLPNEDFLRVLKRLRSRPPADPYGDVMRYFRRGKYINWTPGYESVYLTERDV